MQTGVRGGGKLPPLHDAKKLVLHASVTSLLKITFFLLLRTCRYAAWCSLFGNE
jgi:hypothetical protein